MKILIYSQVFAPKIGGMEEVARLLADAFVAAGHATTVVTMTEDPESTVPPSAFSIVRKPSQSVLRTLGHQADACLLMGPSLNAGLLVLSTGSPIVISHQVGYETPAGIRTLRATAQTAKSIMKTLLCRQAHNVFCSEYMRVSSGHDGAVIPNPYDSERFGRFSKLPKTADVAFVGRMIPDKGAMLLLAAFSHLMARGRRVSATFVGDGPERRHLIDETRKRDLSDAIRFPGPLRGDVLAREISQHRVLVVPSLWQEPFGIVALEGMASGCVIVGTHVGGLPEAIGKAGLVVPPQNPQALANAIGRALDDTLLRKRITSLAAEHLNRHTAESAAAAYLNVLEQAASSEGRYFFSWRNPQTRTTYGS